MDRRRFIKNIVKATPIVVVGATGLGTLATRKLPLNKTVITSKVWEPEISEDTANLMLKMWDPEEVGERIKKSFSNIPRSLLEPHCDTTNLEFEMSILNDIEDRIERKLILEL